MDQGHRPTAAPSAAPPGPQQAPTYTQEGGNTAQQERLGLAASATGATGGEAALFLQDAVRALWDARIDGIDRAWDLAEREDAPDWTEALVGAAVSAALVAASEGVLAGVIGAAVARMEKPDQDITKAVLKSLQATPLTSTAKSAVSSVLGDQRSSGAPSVEAYFVGSKAGARAQEVDELAGYRRAAEALAAASDGAAIRHLADAVAAQAMSAEAAQVERAVVGWMTVLAQADTGRTAGEGSDLTKAGSGRSLRDRLAGDAPRGVLDVRVLFDRTDGLPQLVETEIHGVNTDLIQVLTASGASAARLGLPVFVHGVVATHLGFGKVEVGQNEQGARTHQAFGTGERVLAGIGDGDLERGAAAVVAHVAGRPLAELAPTLPGPF